MKPLNIIILGLGGFILYQWYQKNKSTLTNIPSIGDNTLPPGVTVSVPETTGVPQLVPTPSSILPLNVALGMPPVETGACSCCNKISGISKKHFII